LPIISFHHPRSLGSSRIVDDPSEGFVAAYGRAEILKSDFAARVQPIVDKCMHANPAQGLQMVTAPGRVPVVLYPKRVVTGE
jgi:hypothetical protein